MKYPEKGRMNVYSPVIKEHNPKQLIHTDLTSDVKKITWILFHKTFIFISVEINPPSKKKKMPSQVAQC